MAKPKTQAPAPAPGLLDFLAPSAIQETSRQVTLGDQLGRAYIITDYPPAAPPAWLARVANMPGVAASIHVTPTDPAELVQSVNRSIGELMGRLAQGGNALLVQRTEQALKDAQELLRKIDQEQQSVFYLTVILLVLAHDQDTLARRGRQVEAALAAAGMRGRAAMFLQGDGLKAAGPWGLLPNPIRDVGARNMPAETVAAAFPFTASGLNDGQGIVVGRDKDGGLVLVDIWARGGDRTNSNGTVLAKPGAGKSFALKLLLTREWALGTKIIIIDPEREYGRLARELGGRVINCAAGGINPLQARPLAQDPNAEPDEEEAPATGGGLALHQQLLRTFFSLYLRDLTDLEHAALAQALREVYASRGIGPDTDPATVKEWPTARDLYAAVAAKAEEDPDNWRRLAVLLAEAAQGNEAALWSGPTTVEADADFVVLDVHDLQNASDNVRRAQFFNVLAWAWAEIERDRSERKLLVVDEAWLLVDPQTPQALAFLRDVSKRIRKYGGGLWVISQNVVDFLAPEVARYGQALLDNPSYKLLLAQGEKDLDALARLMSLSEAERELLATAKRGEGLLVTGTQRVRVRIEAAAHEFDLFGAGGGR